MSPVNFKELARSFLTYDVVVTYKKTTERSGLPKLFKTIGLIFLVLVVLRVLLEKISFLYNMPPGLALALIWVPPTLLVTPSVLYSRRVKSLTKDSYIQETLAENLSILSQLLPSSYKHLVEKHPCPDDLLLTRFISEIKLLLKNPLIKPSHLGRQLVLTSPENRLKFLSTLTTLSSVQLSNPTHQIHDPAYKFLSSLPTDKE